MQIEFIKLNNFRNHDEFVIKDIKKINLILGNNGVGKTTITEAINITTLGRSFKTTNLNNTIKFNKLIANIEVKFNKNTSNKINVNLSDKNSYLYNNLDIKRNELYGKIITLIFEPTIFSNFFNDKTFRRKYIDNEISKIYPIHKYNLTTVKKLEKDKKELLRFKYNEKLHNILNKKLSKLYSLISEYRIKFINEINNYYFDIVDTFNINFKEIKLICDSEFKNKNQDQIFTTLSKYKLNETKDKKILLSTNYDNFDINIDNNSVTKYGSQGQQRICFLSFIFATAKIIQTKINFNPVIILDDVFSELDKNNQESLIKLFNDYGQFFITTTDKNININNSNIIEIKTH